MTKVGGQGDDQAMKIGEWYQYKLSVDFPTMTDQSNVEFEVFTNNPDNGNIDNEITGCLMKNIVLLIDRYHK